MGGRALQERAGSRVLRLWLPRRLPDRGRVARAGLRRQLHEGWPLRLAGDGRSGQAEHMTEVLFLGRAEVERLLAPEVCLAPSSTPSVCSAKGRRRRRRSCPCTRSGELPRQGRHAEHRSTLFRREGQRELPGNASRGLPTIQGAVILSDATDGTPLAIMDSGAIGAAHRGGERPRGEASRAQGLAHAAVCGCGGQAEAQLLARCRRRPPSASWCTTSSATRRPRSPTR